MFRSIFASSSSGSILKYAKYMYKVQQWIIEETIIYHTYLLTYVRSWALPEKLPIRKFPTILMNPKVHHRVHKSPPLLPIHLPYTTRNNETSIATMGLKDIYKQNLTKITCIVKIITDWLGAGLPRGRGSSRGVGKNFHFSTSSRPALGPTQPPIQRIREGPFPRG
jgi:hypothetical protein